jgi:uncharacterized protein YecE (DUF72 family)
VEMNNTFYRMPAAPLLRGWRERAPASFRFVLKAPRSMTHIRKLNGCAEPLSQFTGAAQELGDQLGPLLFQLPPTFQRDVERLQGFIGLLPRGTRAAFEFRHPSWFDESTFTALRNENAALCVAEVDDEPTPPVVATANFGYLRLRRLDYTPEELAAWAETVRAQPFAEAFVFFKHELKAPGLALAFMEHFRP